MCVCVFIFEQNIFRKYFFGSDLWKQNLSKYSVFLRQHSFRENSVAPLLTTC